jgi:hypothetical protein
MTSTASFEVLPWGTCKTAVAMLGGYGKLPEEPSTINSLVLAKRALERLALSDDIKERSALQLEANRHRNAAR